MPADRSIPELNPQLAGLPRCDFCGWSGIADELGDAEHRVHHLEHQLTVCHPRARKAHRDALLIRRGELITQLRLLVDRVKTSRGDVEDRVEVLTFERDDARRLVAELEDALAIAVALNDDRDTGGEPAGDELLPIADQWVGCTPAGRMAGCRLPGVHMHTAGTGRPA